MNHTLHDKHLRWQGARLAALSVIVGCAFFFVIDIFPLSIVDLSSTTIKVVIILMVFASLLSLPFSLIGGYILGWFLEKTKRYKQGNAKVIVSGVIIAGATLIIIFVIGGIIQSCVGSHGGCREDFFGYLREVIVGELSGAPLTDVGRIFILRFIKALLIAVTCGGFTALRLSQVAQGRSI